MAISCSLLQWAAGSSTSERFGGVAGLSVQTYRVAVLVEAAESAEVFMAASLVSGYKNIFFNHAQQQTHFTWALAAESEIFFCTAT